MYSFVHREREQRPRTRSKTITTALMLFVVTTRCVQLGLTIFKQNPFLFIGASATEGGYGGYVCYPDCVRLFYLWCKPRIYNKRQQWVLGWLLFFANVFDRKSCTNQMGDS